MAKLTLEDIGTDSFKSIQKYNANMALIETALENTLSRNGTSPNAMGANLDMNSYRILNLPNPIYSSDAVTKTYVDGLVSDSGVTNFNELLITSSGSTTARSLGDRFAEHTNVKDYGAVGDGVADDTAEIQAAITAANASTHKRLYFPAGTYKITAQLIIHSGATWFGDGFNTSTIKVDSSAGNIIPFRTNTVSGTKNVFSQVDVAFYGLHFQGFDAVLTSTASATHSAFMQLWKIDGLIIDRCKFSGHRFIMLSLGGSKNVSITNSEFEDWGRTDNLAGTTLPANEGGPCLWIAANPTDDTPSQFVTVRGNYFHDSEWSCAYLLGQYIDFSHNRMENTKEGNYARTTDVPTPENDSRHITYIGNIHKNVTKRLVQACGFECGAKGAIIMGNTFEDVVGPAVDLSDTCEDTVVTGNSFLDCATSADFSEYGSITIRVSNFTTDAVNGVVVSNNIVRSTGGYYGLRFLRVSGTDTFNNIRVINNDFVGGASSSVNNLAYTSGHFGTDIVIKDNNGASDYPTTSLTWTPTIAATSGSITTSSVTTARYIKIGYIVYFTLVVTVSDNGTGAGSLTFTLPSTALYGGSATGRNATTSVGVTASWPSSASTANVNLATNAYPVTSGDTLRISGFYLEA